jgi:hypothetical protein
LLAIIDIAIILASAWFTFNVPPLSNGTAKTASIDTGVDATNDVVPTISPPPPPVVDTVPVATWYVVPCHHSKLAAVPDADGVKDVAVSCEVPAVGDPQLPTAVPDAPVSATPPDVDIRTYGEVIACALLDVLPMRVSSSAFLNDVEKDMAMTASDQKITHATE